MTYSSRPTKSSAAQRAWDAFTKAIGAEPTDISFGYMESRGNLWTANYKNQVWAYSSGWPKAALWDDSRTPSK